jgi:hypothetical protein
MRFLTRERYSPEASAVAAEIPVAAGVCQPAAPAAKCVPLPDRDTPARTHGTKRGSTDAPVMHPRPHSNRRNLQGVPQTGGSGFDTPDSSPRSSDAKVDLQTFPLLLGQSLMGVDSESPSDGDCKVHPRPVFIKAFLKLISVEKYFGYLLVESVVYKPNRRKELSYHSA